ncbi:MAG TPA: class I SAM-dependent RNA methyltransferase [Anaerolineae bacterium]|nr:class I SAM-dependent RNA methyltransferase [Anaerolineae bacterium]
MPNQPRYDLFATCAPGFEAVAAQELFALGIANPAVDAGGVNFRGFMSHVYKVNLWGRSIERVLLRLGEFNALTFKELHDKARQLDWAQFIQPTRPVSIRATCHKSRLIHSDAVIERVATAIADKFKRNIGADDADEHAQLIVVRLVNDVCTISLDSSGALLHRRGYRQATAKAPLRETLAASMLLASGWTPDQPLIDPFCGSGTIPIEAALIARNIAPGLKRRFACMDWPGFDQRAWQELITKANEALLPKAPALIQGSDRDAGAIEASRANAERAGVLSDIEFTRRAVSGIEPIGRGWIVTNPPYGQRVSEGEDLRNLYAQFGKVVRAKCAGWRVAMLAGDAELEQATKLPFGPAVRVNNGGLRVRFVQTPSQETPA